MIQKVGPLLLGAALLCIGCDDPSGPGGAADGLTDARGLADGPPSEALPDVTGARCRLNSDCPPGLYCAGGLCAFDCRVDRDCRPGTTCQSGECLAALPPDAGRRDVPLLDAEPPRDAAPRDAAPDAAPDCRQTGCPAGSTCDANGGRCVPIDPACGAAGCPGGFYCDAEAGQCRALPLDCAVDPCPAGFACAPTNGRCVAVPADCRAAPCPVDFVCDRNAGACTPAPDCRRDGCPAGQRCDAQTGDCAVAPADLPLGADCEHSPDCASDLCIELAVGGVPAVVCTQPCCSEFDCPVGFGCLYNRGVRLCLPSRIFPPGFTFDASVGQPCRGTACRSGLCDGQRDRCLGTCCVDDDCGAGGLCQWLLAGGTQRLACDPLPFGFGRTGDPCGNEFDCQSRVCVWPGQCADLCCTHADCPGATGCGQVAAFDLNGNISGKVTACTPLPRGETVDGEVCIGDEDCQSGWCIGNVCVEPCCADADCIPPQRCLPRVTPDRVLARVCVEPDPP